MLMYSKWCSSETEFLFVLTISSAWFRCFRIDFVNSCANYTHQKISAWLGGIRFRMQKKGNKKLFHITLCLWPPNQNWLHTLFVPGKLGRFSYSFAWSLRNVFRPPLSLIPVHLKSFNNKYNFQLITLLILLTLVISKTFAEYCFEVDHFNWKSLLTLCAGAGAHLMLMLLHCNKFDVATAQINKV